MSQEIVLPQLGFSMTEATLAEWLIPDGAGVQAGVALFSLETDKAVEEVAAPASGKLRILKPAGQTYPVGEVIAFID
jgi:pyruvate/2-oxoglutarate dehydrogenase complex dihydrolipoamide acyltransferase (E2) component